jgi:transposase-like protein
MTLTKKSACRNSEYQKVSFDLKLSIIDQIINGQISVNHASKVHNISRSSITYWMQKLRTFEQKSKGMSKNDEIKKLRERIEALEFIKEIQQDIIAELEVCTGEDFSKAERRPKLLPESLHKEILKKKQSRTK